MRKHVWMEMKGMSEMCVHETMHVSNKVEISKACLTCVHRKRRNATTVHDTPKHNGVAEWLNWTLLEWVQAMLHASQLPKFLWGEAVKHAVWLKNQTSTRVLDGSYKISMGLNLTCEDSLNLVLKSWFIHLKVPSLMADLSLDNGLVLMKKVVAIAFIHLKNKQFLFKDQSNLILVK